LWKSEVKVQDGKKASEEAESILKQNPNRSILGLRPSLALYNLGDGTDSSFFGNWGKPPVLLDSSKIRRGSQQLQNYYFNNGYFNVTGGYEIKPKERNKKASAVYRLNLGPRYTVDSISYRSGTPEMAKLIEKFAENSELETGMYYDSKKLDAERERLKRIFRNHGFYNFSASYITFLADTVTTQKPLTVNVELIVANRTRRRSDSTYSVPHKQYKVNQVVVHPDYRFMGNYQARDTLQFLEYTLAYDTLAYKPRYLTDALHLKPGKVYRQAAVEETYSHLGSYGAFRLTEITFKEEPATKDSLQPALKAEVKLAPRPKFSIDPQIEATNTSNNFGISGSLGFVDRNIFGGGEELRLDLSSGLEYQPTVGNANNLSRTFETGAELSLEFPRFVLPFNTIGLVPKRMRPTSVLSIYANRTSRIEFERETFGGRLSYAWRENSQKSHRVTLLSLSYSNLFQIQNRFLEQLNPIQQLAFRSEFISSSQYTFTYNGQKSNEQKTYHFFKGDLEVGGTLLSQFTNESNTIADSSNVPVYQFSRLETDYRFYWRLGQEKIWIHRLLLGYVLPYGISEFNSDDGRLRVPPFSRFFFIGGSNDLRAWPAYRAGGGEETITSYRGTPADSNGFSIGTLKALVSSEFRFPIYSYLKGALFVDAGNIWLTGGLEQDNPNSGFALADLGRDLYIGTGLGLRLDLDFFVIRFDTGIKVRDPGFVRQNKEWVIATKPVFPNITYNIALGYPF
jgi:outer membrane protein assembly factor BamA